MTETFKNGQKWLDLRHNVGRATELGKILKSEIGVHLMVYHGYNLFIVYIVCPLYVCNYFPHTIHRILCSSAERQYNAETYGHSCVRFSGDEILDLLLLCDLRSDASCACFLN